MSIYIKGMKMPTDCISCPFCDYEQGLCLASNDMDTAPREIGKRHIDCPLIEVPEHGMSDYLRKEDIINWIDGSLEQCGSRYTTDMINMMEMFRTVINDCIPFADVAERKTGKWEEYFDPDKPIFFQHRFRCTACGESTSYGKSDFCMNCGARMVTDDV